MDFLKNILEERGGELAGGLVDKLGFSTEQAQEFVPEAAQSIFEVVKTKAGEIEVSELAANAASLVDGVDLRALAAKVGIDPAQANSGLGAIVPTLIAEMQEKAGGFTELTSMFSASGAGKMFGGGGALGGIAGKLFGK